MKVSYKFLGVSLIVAALVLVNGYLLLKNNDIILKSYYVNNMQYAQKDVHQEKLTKPAAVVSSMEHYIAAPVDSIGETFVVKGQNVSVSDSLASYKEDDIDTARTALESKITAYENEISELDSILSTLESEANSAIPTATTDSSSVETDLWNLDLTIELGIEQNTPTAEGAAIIQRHIAESTRELDILNSQLDALNQEHSLVTPIDGIVKDIVLEGDMITFVVQSSTKKLVTYVTKDEWMKVEEMQAASFTIFEGDEELEQLIDGSVVAKQEIPARESIGYEQLLARTDLKEDDVVYEVSIEPTDMLATTPIGEIVDVTIITNEAYDSYETYKDWVVNYEVDGLGTEHVYTLGYDGKTRLTPITSAFDHETTINRERVEAEVVEEVPAEQPVEEEVVEPTPPPRIQSVTLLEKEEEATEEEEEDLVEATVFTAGLEDTAIILDGTTKNIFAPTYRPFPIATFEKKAVGPFTWKDAVRYMLP